MPFPPRAVIGQPHPLPDELEGAAQVPPELLDHGQGGHGQRDRRVVAGRRRCGPGLLGRGLRAVEVA